GEMAGLFLFEISVAGGAEMLTRRGVMSALLDRVRRLVREQMHPRCGRRLILVPAEVDISADGERARVQEVRGAVSVRVVVDRDAVEAVAARARELLAHGVGQGARCAARADRARRLAPDGAAGRRASGGREPRMLRGA